LLILFSAISLFLTQHLTLGLFVVYRFYEWTLDCSNTFLGKKSSCGNDRVNGITGFAREFVLVGLQTVPGRFFSAFIVEPPRQNPDRDKAPDLQALRLL
jgi:hypothetical protein